jgi:hypothetical protein
MDLRPERASPSSRSFDLAKNQNTFEKRRREVEKRQRSADKLERKRQRKLQGGSAAAPPVAHPDDTDSTV